MKFSFLTFALFLFALPPVTGFAVDSKSLQAKKMGAKRIQYQGVTYDTYIVSPKNRALHFYWKDRNQRQYGTIRHLKIQLRKQNYRLEFAMNGGIFEFGQIPLGLYVENYKQLTPINRKRGRGNFYVQPNGVFYIRGNKAYVRTTRAYRSHPRTRYAVQSGPMLVINNRINWVFRSRSPSKYVRNGVGVDRNGNIVFAISNSRVNLYQFSAFFKRRMRCRNALYMDGNISQMYSPKLKRHEQDGHFASILAIVRKAGR